jgi:hypothetical protein
MTTRELAQTVLPPDASDELEAAAEALNEEVPLTWQLWIKLKIDGVLHPFGIHHFVRLREYDVNSDRLIETGALVCRVGDCPVARYE